MFFGGICLLDESEFQRWLRTALKNLDSARGDLERGDFNWACFKAHQAAEMALKALLHGLGLPAYGHSLSKLLQRIEEADLKASEENMKLAKSLDKLYVPTRYPNAWSEGSPHEYYTEEDADQAIEYAKKLIEWVVERWRQLEKG